MRDLKLARDRFERSVAENYRVLRELRSVPRWRVLRRRTLRRQLV